MRRKKLLNRILYGVMLHVAIGAPCFNAYAQSISLEVPWKLGEIWKVNQGYHQSVGSEGGKFNYALDFSPVDKSKSSLAVVAVADGLAYAVEDFIKPFPCTDVGRNDLTWNPPTRMIRLNMDSLPMKQGREVTYTHVQNFDTLGIKPGDSPVKVRKGQVLGYMGNQGCTQAPHLDFVYLKDGVAQPIPSFEGVAKSSPKYPDTRTNMSPIKQEPNYYYQGQLGGYPSGDQYLSYNSLATWHPSGALVRQAGEEKIYLLQGKEKRWVVTAEDFTAQGFRWEEIIVVSPKELSCYKDGDNVTKTTLTSEVWPSVFFGFPERRLIQFTGVKDAYKVYVVSDGKLHWLDIKGEDLVSFGYQWKNIVTLDASYFREEAVGVSFTADMFKTRCEILPPTPSSPPPGVNLSRVVVPNTDPKYFGLDPLTVFYHDPSDPMRRPTILVGYDGGIRAFTYDASFLWETHDAWGNMELDGDRVYAFGSVPEYVNNISTGFS